MKLLTPAAVRQAVLVRDSFACVAPVVDTLSGQCHDRYGRPGFGVNIAHLELDHIRDTAMMGKTAPTDPAHLVTLCPGHHRGVGEKAGWIWATSRRLMLRDYLRAKGKSASVPMRLGLKDDGFRLTSPLDPSENSPAGEPPVSAGGGSA